MSVREPWPLSGVVQSDLSLLLVSKPAPGVRKMAIRQSLLFAAALGLGMPQAMAAPNDDLKASTTQDFVDICSTDPSSPAYASAIQFCYGYITGATQLYYALLGPEGIRPIACPRGEVTRQGAVDVFLDWARRNPELLGKEQPIQGLMRAAAEKWPCTQRTTAR